jgi:type I restriction enzyme S subunit
MTPHDLIAAFETLADAPYGVRRLRELVLSLAVQGKLVRQVAQEGSGKSVLDRVAKARGRLVARREIRPPRAIPPIDLESVPCALPPSWSWARLDQLPLVPLADGDWVESKDQDPDGAVRLIQLADVGENEFRNRSDRYLNDESAAQLNCTFLEPRDVLIARLPAPIGRACIFPGLLQPCVTVVDVAIARFNADVDVQFMVHAINSSTVRGQIEAYGKGATRFRVSTGHLRHVNPRCLHS